MKNIMRVSLMFLTYCACYTSDGTLDPSFGAGTGFVDTPAGVQAVRVGVQTDGNIVVLGGTVLGPQLVRYNTVGTIDSSFGVGGIVTIPSTTTVNNFVIQADGKIVVVGVDTIAAEFQLIRYNTDGSLDLTFGIGGNVAGPGGIANAVALQSDSKIVVAGEDFANNIEVIRYNIDGTLDINFASGPTGIVSDVIVQPDGKFVVAGISSTNNVEVVRYNTDGSLDGTFGIGGIATGPSGRVHAVLLQSDGNIVVSGYNSPITPSLQLVRFTASGILDTTFGIGGVAIAFINTFGTYALLQSDEKVVAVGYDPVLNIFKLARFTTGGIPDITFGTGGLTVGPTGRAFGTASQADGKIITVGSDFNFTNFQVARYIGGPALIPTTIAFPRNGSRFAGNATVSFRGVAQGQSMVYLFLDGVLVAGTATDPVNNRWAITQVVSSNSGVHTAYAVAVYGNGNVDILSNIVTFTVQGGGCC